MVQTKIWQGELLVVQMNHWMGTYMNAGCPSCEDYISTWLLTAGSLCCPVSDFHVICSGHGRIEGGRCHCDHLYSGNVCQYKGMSTACTMPWKLCLEQQVPIQEHKTRGHKDFLRAFTFSSRRFRWLNISDCSIMLLSHSFRWVLGWLGLWSSWTVHKCGCHFISPDAMLLPDGLVWERLQQGWARFPNCSLVYDLI